MTSRRILEKSLYLSSYRMSYPSYKSSSACLQTSRIGFEFMFWAADAQFYKCTLCSCCVCNRLNFTRWSCVLPSRGWYLGDIWKITAEFYQPSASLFRTSNSAQAGGSVSKITAHNDNLLEKYQKLGNIKNLHMTMLPFFFFLKKEFLGFHLIHLFFSWDREGIM